MPEKLQIVLKGDDDKRHGFYMAAMLHGALMELMNPADAAQLHTDAMHPFSQYITNEKGQLIWHIQTLDDTTHRIFANALEGRKDIFLKHRDETLEIISREENSISEEALIDRYYFGQCDPVLKIRFCSPTSFKQDGHYALFPSVRLIFQSLMLRYDAGSAEHEVFSQDVLSDFEHHAAITGYRLRSAYFHTDHARIPAFLGEVTIRVWGPQQMINLAWLLAAYGTFSGVGIKTGLGMGGMTLLNERRADDRGTISG